MNFSSFFSRPSLPLFAENKEHLLTLIRQCIQEKGFKCSLNHIDVSNVQDMSELFARVTHFNGDISQWNVSNVTNMRMMFGNSIFNGDISRWDVAKVTNMQEMFWSSYFNGDLSPWSVSNVTDMNGMFEQSSFNGDISKWNVSNVQDMSCMFCASTFTGDISRWNISKVRNMSSIFRKASFTGDISSWGLHPECMVSNAISPEIFLESAPCQAFIFSGLAISCMLLHKYNVSQHSSLMDAVRIVRTLGLMPVEGGKYVSNLLLKLQPCVEDPLFHDFRIESGSI